MNNEENSPGFGLNRFEQALDNITRRIPAPAYRLFGYACTTTLAVKTAIAILEHNFAAAAFEGAMTTVLGSVTYFADEPKRLRSAYNHMQEKIFEIPYREYAKQASLNLAQEMDDKFHLSERFNLAAGSTKQKLFHTYLAAEVVSFGETMPKVSREYDLKPEELNDIQADIARLRAREGDTSAALITLVYEQVPLIHQGIELSFDSDIRQLEEEVDSQSGQGNWAPREIAFAAEVLVHGLEGVGKNLLVMNFLPEALHTAQTTKAHGLRERYMRRTLHNYLAEVNESLNEENSDAFWQRMEDPIRAIINKITYSKGIN